MISKIDIFWVWLGDVAELVVWGFIIGALSLALFMLTYSFNDFSNNMNNREIMKGEGPFSKRKHHKTKK